MYASRAWWVLYYIGLDNISILDGGYVKWVEAGFATTEKIPVRDAKQLQPKVRNDLFVDIEAVKEKVIKKEAILIDSRAPERYRGEVEPLYAKAGHKGVQLLLDISRVLVKKLNPFMQKQVISLEQLTFPTKTFIEMMVLGKVNQNYRKYLPHYRKQRRLLFPVVPEYQLVLMFLA